MEVEANQIVQRFKFEEGVDQTLSVIPLQENLYRLNVTPVFLDEQLACFGDIIEAEKQEDGILQFRRVVERSTWQHWCWFLPKSIVESSVITTFKQLIEVQRGVWEQLFGGFFIVHLPEGSAFDPQVELEQLQAHVQAEAASQKSGESSEPLL